MINLSIVTGLMQVKNKNMLIYHMKSQIVGGTKHRRIPVGFVLKLSKTPASLWNSIRTSRIQDDSFLFPSTILSPSLL
ncbi:hypothetical protein VNO77_12237 [Canavalia gladiata]|uniref:Uncharacterized protein n=1 Tax=Canavalia gladiata TaxID=3824 RepID=A0AAN9LWL9_CANGL